MDRKQTARSHVLPALSLLTAVFLVSGARAAMAAPLLLYLEPVIGYEWALKTVPGRHHVRRPYYGGRLTFGFPVFALETEFTHADDEEFFPAPELHTMDNDNRISIGLKSEPRLSRFFAIPIRAGARGVMNTHEETRPDSKCKIRRPIKFSPYIGTGFSITILNKVVLSVGATVIINKFMDLSKNEYQLMTSMALKFY